MARLSTWRYGFKSRWGDLTGFSGKTLFQSGLLLWSQHFNSLKILDSWPTGRGSRLKPGGGSFDSNTVHLRAWCMCMRMVQLHAQGLYACVRFNYVRRVWDQSGLQLLTWMVRIHLCTSCLIRSIGEDRGLLILQYGFESCMRHPGM